MSERANSVRTMTAAHAETPVPPVLRPILRAVAADRPDAGLSTDELGSHIVVLASRLAAATCRWLLLVAEFDARAGHEQMGLASTARWLSHCCGIAHRTAVDHVRVARALAGFSALAAAMSAGRLSYSHVRAIARVARADEQHLDADLIEVGRTPLLSRQTLRSGNVYKSHRPR